MICVLAFVAALVTTFVLASEATLAIGIKAGSNPLALATFTRVRIGQLADEPLAKDVARIAYLGDSTVVTFKKQHSLPDALASALGAALAGERDVAVFNMAAPAMGIASYAFLADEIARVAPDLIVWETSLTHVAREWQTVSMVESLVGFADAARLPALLALPTARIGITADEILLRKAIVSAGLFPRWRSLRDRQSRFAVLRGRLDAALGAAVGTRPEADFRRRTRVHERATEVLTRGPYRRYAASRERAHFGVALTGVGPGHPVLRLLGLALERFRAADIPVVVYLNPINVDNLAAVGVLDPAALERSVASFRDTVEDTGARFLDLHALLPDALFSDAAGHFGGADGVMASTLLIDALAPAVVESLREARPPTPAPETRAD